MANCILDPQRDCLGLAKAEMLEKQVEEYREKSSKDHREMYDRIRQLEIANAKTDTQYGQIMETLGALKVGHCGAEDETRPPVGCCCGQDSAGCYWRYCRLYHVTGRILKEESNILWTF